jgi:hypothetical protein
MKQTKKLLLTFDYEPFLGARTGTAAKCMLEPTEAVLQIMNKYNAKGVFFVDVLYMLNLKKHSELFKDTNAIGAQLNKLHTEGHYVFPHIHPHWLDAEYNKETGQFALNNLSRYSLAKLQTAEAAKLFTDALDYLKEIGISYGDWGYRAGGWCIQPFSRYKDVFEKEHMAYDMSVLPGYKNLHPDQTFDFSRVKNRKPYRFTDVVETEVANGKFVELPVSTIEIGGLAKTKDNLLRKYLWRTGDKGWGDGAGAQTAALKVNLYNNEMISIELLTSAKLNSYKRYIDREDYMHWISHPKMLTRHGLSMFGKFMEYAADKYEAVYDFHKMLP